MSSLIFPVLILVSIIRKIPFFPLYLPWYLETGFLISSISFLGTSRKPQLFIIDPRNTTSSIRPTGSQIYSDLNLYFRPIPSGCMGLDLRKVHAVILFLLSMMTQLLDVTSWYVLFLLPYPNLPTPILSSLYTPTHIIDKEWTSSRNQESPVKEWSKDLVSWNGGEEIRRRGGSGWVHRNR